MKDIEISFPGGKRVDAKVGELLVHTDQPVELGGEASAIAPFELFLASLATCAGYYVLAFCQARGLSLEGIGVRQRVVDVDAATYLPRHVRIEITLPAGFPEKYRAAVVRAADGCKVRKAIASAPVVDVVAVAAPDVALPRAS